MNKKKIQEIVTFIEVEEQEERIWEDDKKVINYSSRTPAQYDENYWRRYLVDIE